MRSSNRAISFLIAVLAAVLSCVIASPAVASGEDKPAASPAAPSGTVVRPDREKKVYTNDDIDRMWPKEQAAANDQFHLRNREATFAIRWTFAITPPKMTDATGAHGRTGMWRANLR